MSSIWPHPPTGIIGSASDPQSHTHLVLPRHFPAPRYRGRRTAAIRCGSLYRGQNSKYRIGYAESPDGRDWRLDLSKAGIDVSTSGWDSEIDRVPVRIRSPRDPLSMLYNGNGYGRTGFGLAKMVTA